MVFCIDTHYASSQQHNFVFVSLLSHSTKGTNCAECSTAKCIIMAHYLAWIKEMTFHKIIVMFTGVHCSMGRPEILIIKQQQQTPCSIVPYTITHIIHQSVQQLPADLETNPLKMIAHVMLFIYHTIFSAISYMYFTLLWYVIFRMLSETLTPNVGEFVAACSFSARYYTSPHNW